VTDAPVPLEELEHGADSALRIHGADCKALLSNAALGMFSLMADWGDSPLSTEREIHLRAIDSETLLVDWLNELLYLHELQGVVYTDFEILSASPESLQAIARGTDDWHPRTAIKAATFNDLSIEKTAEGFTATIVFDT
jgi:SHS2 domain-containing protein